MKWDIRKEPILLEFLYLKYKHNSDDNVPIAPNHVCFPISELVLVQYVKEAKRLCVCFWVHMSGCQ